MKGEYLLLLSDKKRYKKKMSSLRDYIIIIQGGIFFMSFKNRCNDFKKDGRTFTCFTRKTLHDFVNDNFKVEIIELIETNDVRSDRSEEGWISIVVRK